jgi:hypothetical protein
MRNSFKKMAQREVLARYADEVRHLELEQLDKLDELTGKASKYPIVQDFLKLVFKTKHCNTSIARDKAKKAMMKTLEIMNSKAAQLAVELEREII